jgi:hypothetical protein
LQAQNATISIRIKLIDGLTGYPLKNSEVGLEDGTDYRKISARTNQLGVASVKIRKDAVILVHNTDQYVNCGDERGGLVHNDFRVNEILSTGIVEAIQQPNACGKVSAVLSPGQLTLFVRRWRRGEKI